jgi:hypothetical protein
VWQHKVFTKLLGLQYKVIYRKGSKNRAADALSHRHQSPDKLLTISTPTPQWLLSIQANYDQDEFAQGLIAKLALDPKAVSHYTLKDGILRYKRRI